MAVERTYREIVRELALDRYGYVTTRQASEAGVPIPGFSSALSYYDLVRAKRTNAALTQGLRDFFGSHTYRRVDTDGTFHTQWSGDRSEVEAVDSH
mgnify:CR=1 FL=1